MDGFVSSLKAARARRRVAVAIAALAGLVAGVRALRSARPPRLERSALATTSDDHARTGARARAPDRDDGAARAARRIALGRKIFFDPSLSEPAGTSCATCHDPSLAYAGNNGSTLGVARGSRPGHFARRNTPSVMYLGFVRPFHFHWEEDAPLPDAFGGFFWDGRVDSIAALVRQPLLNPDEMGNASEAQVHDKVANSAYADELAREFPGARASPDAALTALGQAVESFLKSPALSPFSSKYDAYVRGETTLTPLESQGLRVFKDAARGGCAECHKLNDTTHRPELSLFTDYGYEVAAPPRNPRIPQNRNPLHHDLGLCERDDPRTHTDESRLCGSFRTPSLRNVALRPSFMHNGVFSKLRDVVAFYASRDTSPRRWYRSGVAFEDLPPRYRENVNTVAVPYNRNRKQSALLDDGDIDALVAFLGTLTDTRLSL
jgi:cytochrome c peroxidase